MIVFPTDTVYGIGCNPYNQTAIKKVYKIKSRDASKPLPMLVDSIATAQRISAMSTGALNLARAFWPGPLTIIADVTDARIFQSPQSHNHSSGAENSGNGSGIALRIPAHQCTRKLLDMCKIIAGTSANISGTDATGDPAECADSMIGCEMILDGGIIHEPAASTIVDARGSNPIMIRCGRVSQSKIQDAWYSKQVR